MNALDRFEPSERRLILIAAALLGLFILWQFLIAPTLGAASDARRSLETAKRDHSIVTAGLPALAAQNAGGAKAAFDRNAVVQIARTANVTISRVQPASDGSLQVWLDPAPTQSVYAFLSELETRYRTETIRAQISREDGAAISAQFTFAAK